MYRTAGTSETREGNDPCGLSTCGQSEMVGRFSHMFFPVAMGHAGTGTGELGFVTLQNRPGTGGQPPGAPEANACVPALVRGADGGPTTGGLWCTGNVDDRGERGTDHRSGGRHGPGDRS